MLFASIFTNYDVLPFRLRSHRISGILSTRIEQIQVQGLHCKRKNWIDGRWTVAQQSRTVEWMGCYGITRHDKLAEINVRTLLNTRVYRSKTHPRSTKSLKRLIGLMYEWCRRINYMTTWSCSDACNSPSSQRSSSFGIYRAQNLHWRDGSVYSLHWIGPLCWYFAALKI